MKGHMNTNKNNEDIVACTQEALLCPDGTGVGRTGDECSFSPCPSNEEGLVGELRFQNDSFSLIIPSPLSAGQEVTYVVPLAITSEIDTTLFVGELVNVKGVYTEGNTFLVSAIEKADGDVTEGTAEVGETIYVNGVRITLEKILSDSRCPIDVTCIQAGSVTLEATLRSDTDTDTVKLTSGENPVAFDSYLVSLVDAHPAPRSKETQDFSSYRATFKVETNELPLSR